MKPYYDHAGVTIYHGDCREVMRSAFHMVDALITDPPYGVGFDYGNGAGDTVGEMRAVVGPAIEYAETLVAKGGYCAVWQSPKHWRSWSEWFPRAERLIALPKRFVQIYPNVPWWATDYALLWRIPKPDSPAPRFEDWMPKPNRDWFITDAPNFGAGRGSIKHPCPRPLDAAKYLVGCFSRPESVVLDPFCGSGTTLRAAKDLGRRAIGIEIEERYCEIAAKRCAQEVMALDAEGK